MSTGEGSGPQAQVNPPAGWRRAEANTFGSVKAADGYTYRVAVDMFSQTEASVIFLSNKAKNKIPKNLLLPDLVPPVDKIRTDQADANGSSQDNTPGGGGPSVTEPNSVPVTTAAGPPTTLAGGLGPGPVPVQPGDTDDLIRALAQQMNQLTALQQTLTSSQITMTNFQQGSTSDLQQLMTQLVADSTESKAALQAAMEKLGKNSEEPEKQAEKVKEVVYHETEIDDTTDDMHQNLTDGRWLPLGTDLPFYQTRVPKVSLPLRTNYALEEIGITPSRYRGIHMAHERASPNLLLKMYRPENLTRTEDVKTWAVSGGKFKQTAEEAEITDAYGALRALMNYFLIRKRICPGDFEVDTMIAAVFNLYFDNVLKPSGKDIAAFFVRWQGRRASIASVGKHVNISVHLY